MLGRKNDFVTSEFRNIGIPECVLHTTMAGEELSYVWDIVKKHDWGKSIFLYGNNSVKLNMAFYLIAKQMYKKTSVMCFTVQEIILLLSDMNSEAVERINNTNLVFLDCFFDTGTPSPFSPAEIWLFIGWIKKQMNNNYNFVFLSDKKLSIASKWWPESFIKILTNNTIELEVK